MDPIFPDGVMVREPHSTAPSFVKGSIIINPEKFIEWAKNNSTHLSEKGWLSLDIKESKKGGWYAQLNTWKKPTDAAPEATASQEAPQAEEGDDNGIPF